ncbi:MAG TPA: hypothetical protein PLI57_05975 [Spirochaetota bacterium]|nr:hypothetical protein [Spirochaetota bacterium]
MGLFYIAGQFDTYVSNFIRQLSRVIDASHMCQFLSGSGAAYVAHMRRISIGE